MIETEQTISNAKEAIPLMKSNGNDDDNGRNNAFSKLESIHEMVANLEQKGALQNYVKNMDGDDLLAFLKRERDSNDPKGFVFDPGDVSGLRDLAMELIKDGRVDPPDGFEFDEETAREIIQEDPLSVEVRGGWHSPCGDPEDNRPEEFQILLSYGGPSCRIIGELYRDLCPANPRLEYQDWFQPWRAVPLSSADWDALVRYAGEFFYGE